MLARNPAFTFVAVLTLALGFGDHTALFAVVISFVLRRLPFKTPERLVRVEEPGDFFSKPDLADFVEQNQVFDALAATTPLWRFNLIGPNEPQQVQATYASAGFFSILGIQPALGRVYSTADDNAAAHPTVVLSHGLWQRAFGGDAKILGKTISLTTRPFTVAGVMPRDFRYLDDTDLYIPMAFNPLVGRNVRFFRVLGRLKPGLTVQDAQSAMTLIAARLEKQYPDSNRGVGVRIIPLHRKITGNVEAALLVLLSAVGLMLLIACANVASLLLARATARQREVAIRVALGAGRWRLIRQFLTESALLAMAGGAAGFWVAVWSRDALMALSPPDFPRRAEIGIDAQVLAFTFVLSLVTGLIFGLVPAWQASSTRISAGRFGRQPLRGLLVVSEMALALVLLIGSGLLIRSYEFLLGISPGFNPHNLLTAQLLLPPTQYPTPEHRRVFFNQLEEHIDGVAGVESCGVVSRLPLSGTTLTSVLIVEGHPAAGGVVPQIEYRVASHDYFRAMGIPLLEGRSFTRDDTSGVVLLNDAAVRRFFAGEDPIGKRVKTGFGDNVPWQTVVGVVGSVRHFAIDIEPQPEIYRPYLVNPLTSPILVVRTSRDPRTMIAAVRAQIRIVDANLPVSQIDVMDDAVARSLAQRRFAMLLLGLFAGVAMVLAAVGIYGVVSYSVSQRTQEIGIRMALGAQARDVLLLILGQGMRLALAGAGIGLVAAFGATRLMSSLLYGVSPRDPAAFVALSFLLAAVALAACYVPARRATRVDPISALRQD